MKKNTTKLDSHGRVVIPANFRRAIGLHEGDELTIQLEGATLRILTRAAAITKAQELVTKRTKGKRSLVDELTAERRAEASSE